MNLVNNFLASCFSAIRSSTNFYIRLMAYCRMRVMAAARTNRNSSFPWNETKEKILISWFPYALYIMHYAKICATAIRHKKINLWESFIFWLVESVALCLIRYTKVQCYTKVCATAYNWQEVYSMKYTHSDNLPHSLLASTSWEFIASLYDALYSLDKTSYEVIRENTVESCNVF